MDQTTRVRVRVNLDYAEAHDPPSMIMSLILIFGVGVFLFCEQYMYMGGGVLCYAATTIAIARGGDFGDLVSLSLSPGSR